MPSADICAAVVYAQVRDDIGSINYESISIDFTSKAALKTSDEGDE